MKPLRLWIYRLLMRWVPETRMFRFKVWMLRWAGVCVEDDVRICSSASIYGDGHLILGKDVWLGPQVTISSSGSATVKVCDYSGLAIQTTILTGSHEVTPEDVRIFGRGINQDVIIGKGCMIGARVTILPGVTLADKTLVAAGAVVTKSVDVPCSLVAGVPAVLKKHLA